LCPEWTHHTGRGGSGNDVLAHAWEDTEASKLFAEAFVEPATGRRLPQREASRLRQSQATMVRGMDFRFPGKAYQMRPDASGLREAR
jgi:hypothetical protein